MQRFMQEKNLTLFLRRLLAEQKDMDEERRQVISKLVAEEEAKNGTTDQPYPTLRTPRGNSQKGWLRSTTNIPR
jgi:hypothetical protein